MLKLSEGYGAVNGKVAETEMPTINGKLVQVIPTTAQADVVVEKGAYSECAKRACCAVKVTHIAIWTIACLTVFSGGVLFDYQTVSSHPEDTGNIMSVYLTGAVTAGAMGVVMSVGMGSYFAARCCCKTFFDAASC